MILVDSNHEIQIKMQKKKKKTAPPSNCQLLPLFIVTWKADEGG